MNDAVSTTNNYTTDSAVEEAAELLKKKCIEFEDTDFLISDVLKRREQRVKLFRYLDRWYEVLCDYWVVKVSF
jgi:hypothetical protein